MGLSALKADGTWLNLPLESRRNLIELSALKAGGTLFFFKRKQRLRLWERILCPARTAARRTSSGRRPSVRVPWPDGINLLSALQSKSTDTSRLRADHDASAETCEKVLRTFSVCSGASQTAIKTRIRRCRANVKPNNRL